MIVMNKKRNAFGSKYFWLISTLAAGSFFGSLIVIPWLSNDTYLTPIWLIITLMAVLNMLALLYGYISSLGPKNSEGKD